MHPLVIRLACCTLAPLIATACSVVAEPSTPPAITATAPASDQARLVVYRPAATHLLGAIGERPVEIGAQPPCALGDGHFFIRDVPPGPIVISDGGSRLSLHAAGGERYVVRVSFNPRRASLAGWILPLIGFASEVQTAAPDSGLFEIAIVARADADPELLHLAPEPACR